MERSSLYHLIEKYFNNESTPEEESALMTWYRLAHRDTVEWPSAYPDEEQQVKARMLQYIETRRTPASSIERITPSVKITPLAKITEPAKITPPVKTTPSVKRIPIKRGLVAAALLFVICTSAFFFLRRSDPAAGGWVTLNSPAGKIQKIGLPDGSEVWLNANSQLRYRKDFSAKREIELEGEAFFKVSPANSRPFLVRSRGILTQVLGTAFNIDAYKNEPLLHISVQSGKIAVKELKTGNAQAVLTADQEMAYDVVSSRMEIRKAPAGNSSWINGKWQFETATMEEITGLLENWYGVHFSFASNALRSCQYTATFDNTIRLKDLLTLLCDINNIHFTIDETNRTVTLSGKGCPG